MWSMHVVIMHHGMRSGAGQGTYEAYEGSVPSAAFSAQRGSRPGHLPCRQRRGTCRRYTIGAWVGGDGHDEFTSSQGSEIRAGRYACVWACFALRAVHAGWMQAYCMSSWGRAILSLGGQAPKVTNFEELWRFTFCSDDANSWETYVSRHHSWPHAKRLRPSMPSQQHYCGGHL
jgi:hypothetical protein